MDSVTTTTSTGNDHHVVAHSNFQLDVATNITKNQRSLDEAWTKGTDLSKEYGKLLALDAGELTGTTGVSARWRRSAAG